MKARRTGSDTEGSQALVGGNPATILVAGLADCKREGFAAERRAIWQCFAFKPS